MLSTKSEPRSVPLEALKSPEPRQDTALAKPTSEAGESRHGEGMDQPPPATTHSHDEKTANQAKHNYQPVQAP